MPFFAVRCDGQLRLGARREWRDDDDDDLGAMFAALHHHAGEVKIGAAYVGGVTD